MRPNMRKDRITSWSIFAGSILSSLILLSIFSSNGKPENKLEQEKKSWEKRNGKKSPLLSKQIKEQKTFNLKLNGNIEDLKTRMGIKYHNPFVLPKNSNDKQYYLSSLFYLVQENLHILSNKKKIGDFDTSLGYTNKLENTLVDEDVPDELIRLQLISKAVLLALSTEEKEPFQKIEITHGNIDYTGPENRDKPLIAEYSFEIKVRGSLKDILWLIHQLGIEKPTKLTQKKFSTFYRKIQPKTKKKFTPSSKDFFPLVVRSLSIESENSSSIDDISQLDATIGLAGMRFLTEEEQEKAKASFSNNTGRKSNGKRNSGRRRNK